MKAVYIESYGDNEILKFSKDFTKPKIQNKDDILIKIHAASLNPIDYKMRSGFFHLKYRIN